MLNYYEIITKLIGEIEPAGETNIDDVRYENLEQMTLLVNRLIIDIQEVAENSNRVEYSMKRAGEYAIKFLKYNNIGEAE